MGDHQQQQQRSPSTPDSFYNILGISKGATSIRDLCKGFMKWGPNEKSPSNKSPSVDEISTISDAEKSYHGPQEDFIISNPTTPTRYNIHRNSIVEDQFSSRSSSVFARTTSNRRSKTPSPTPRSLSRETSRRSTTPTSRTHSAGRRSNSVSEFPAGFSKTFSRKTYSLSAHEDPSQCLSPQNTSSSNNITGRCTSLSRSTSTGTSSVNVSPLSRDKSRNTRGPTPIVFSQSTAPTKPSPVERKLECTLEELCHGGVKKIMITREVISNGIIIQEEEMLKIDVKPGWTRGTKITFEGKGDLKLGFLPADIIFSIDEKKHPLYRREGDDLELGVEIPLVQALTNCSINVPLLGGEKMRLSFENVILYPGYEKVIKGQGMPNSKNGGRRGDLRIRFLVNFPSDLSDEQRAEACSILQECS